MHLAVASFVSMLREPHKFPVKAVEEFHRWATLLGFSPNVDTLLNVQLGMVCMHIRAPLPGLVSKGAL